MLWRRVHVSQTETGGVKRQKYSHLLAAQELSCCWVGRVMLRVPLSVNSVDKRAISLRFQLIAQFQWNFRFSAGVPLSQFFSIIYENNSINYVLSKTRFFGYIFFISDSVDLTSTTLTKLEFGPNATVIGKITQINSRNVVGHPRSPISILIESPHTRLHNKSNLHRMSHRFQDILDYWSNFWCRQGVHVFNALPKLQNCEIQRHKTRDIVLRHGAKHISLSRSIWAWLKSVTDGQTDTHYHNKPMLRLTTSRGKNDSMTPCDNLFENDARIFEGPPPYRQIGVVRMA